MIPAKQKRGSGELVTQAEAAKLLCVPPKAVLRLMERGILEPVRQQGTKRWFDLRDVSAASDAIEQKLGFASILETSTRAHTAAQRVERKLNVLLEFFGLDQLQPQATKETIEANELRGYELLAAGTTNPADIMAWAKVIMRVDDAYLRLSEHYLRKGEPWLILLSSTNHIISSVPVDDMRDPDMAMALSLLSYSRKHLLNESYSYCRYTMGKKIANTSFPDMMRGEVNDIIGALLRS